MPTTTDIEMSHTVVYTFAGVIAAVLAAFAAVGGGNWSYRGSPVKNAATLATSNWGFLYEAQLGCCSGTLNKNGGVLRSWRYIKFV